MIHFSKVRIRSESNELDNFNFHELYAYLVAFFSLLIGFSNITIILGKYSKRLF